MAIPTIFDGKLPSNKVFTALFNMIQSQQVLSKNIADTKSTLVDMSRVDGSMYGSVRLYYSTDVLGSVEWNGDEETNLLELHRPEAPECQSIELDQYRMIALTVDNYLSKQAWGTEGAFNQFNSQMIAWMRDTKKIFDATMFNTYIGTTESLEGKQIVNIPVGAEPDGDSDVELEAYNRLYAMRVGQGVADLIVDLEDISRDYNDFGNLRSYDINDLVFVWNADVVNQIRKVDLPSLFHKDGIIDKFADHTLPARYFGNVKTTGGTTSSENTTTRSLIEKDYNTVKPNKPGYDAKLHVFPGDLIPANTAYEAYEAYDEDPSIICKIYHKDSVPLMSGFETGTEFFNTRSLTQNHYLIWAYNKLQYLKNYPFITVKVTQ
jgi:hypothetical protein